MLNRGVLSFDAAGRIRIANAVSPTNFNGGTPTVGTTGPASLLCGNNAGPEVYVGGAGYLNSGILCATAVGSVTSYSQGGLPLVASGEVAIDPTGAISFYNAGLPYTAAGKLVTAVAEAPVVTGAFSSAFAPAFD